MDNAKNTIETVSTANGVKVKGRSRLDYNKATQRFTIKDIGVAYSGLNATSEEAIKRIVPTFHRESFQSALRTTQAPESVQPKEENTLFVPFRLISATIIGAGTWKATDFTNEEVLRASVPLLVGKPVHSEHDQSANNWLGKVVETVWTPRFVQGGIDIPAGIDGILAIDTTTQRGEDIAKGITMGAVVSNSVSIEFEWELSHTVETEDDLWDTLFYRIGEIAPDGKMYTRVVTRIVDYYESSIVSLGADPYAKKIDEQGNLTMIDKVGAEVTQAAVQALSAEQRISFAKGATATCQTATVSNDVFRSFVALSKRLDFEDVVTPVTVKTETPQAEQVKSALGALMDLRINDLVSKGNYASRTEVINALADACDCSPRTIRNYMNGTTKCPSQNSLVAMAGVLLTAQGDFITEAQKDGCSYTEPVSTPIVVSSAIDAGKDKKDGTDSADMGCDDDEEDETEGTESADMAAAKTRIVELEAQIVELQKASQTANTEKSGFVSALKKATEEAEQMKRGIEESNTAIATLRGEIELQKERFNAERGQLQRENAVLTAQAQFGKEQLDLIRAEAVRYYNASMGANAQPAMRRMLETTDDIQFIKETVKSFGGKLSGMFSHHCNECGSEDICFGSVKVVENKETHSVVTQTPEPFPTKFERTRR